MAAINITASFEDYRLVAQTQDDHTSQLVRDPVTGAQTQQKWLWKRHLGEGGFGSVWQEAWEDEYGDWRYRAVKSCSELKLKRHEIDYRRELSALAAFSTSECAAWFVNFHGWWRESSTIFVATEYLRLGDLSKYTQQDIPEVGIKEIADNVLRGLEVMHSHGFAHRDIKPENILVCQKRPESPRWWVKIADFGISKQAAPGSSAALYTAIATPLYCAPEIYSILQSHDDCKTVYSNKVDMWSFGCVLFNLASRGHPAFSIPDLVRFCDGNIGFNPRNLTLHLSEDGKLLVKTLLEADPDKRPSATMALESSWLKRPSHVGPRLQSVSIPYRTKSSHQERNVLHNSSLSEEDFGRWLEKHVRNNKRKGTTALHIATREERLDLVKYILEHKELHHHADIGTLDVKDENLRSPLNLAASFGHLAIARYLVDCGADTESKCEDGHTPLHTALRYGYADMAFLLIELGASIAAKDKEGNTPMHWASQIGRSEARLKRGFKYKNNVPRHQISNYEPMICVIKLLVIILQADLEAKDNKNRTPLHNACRYGPLRLVQCLVDFGADVEAKGVGGETPLHSSVIGGEPGIVQFLLERGANVRANSRSSKSHRSNRTALHYASESVSVVRNTLANPRYQLIGDQNDYYKGVVLAAQVLIEYGVDLEATDSDGQTPLHHATYHNFPKLAQLLINNGADIEAKDSHGQTPLHLAASSNSTEVSQLLISSGASIETKNIRGHTPLHGAAYKNSTELAQLLISIGADPTAMSILKKTPAQVAAAKGHEELASWLEHCQAGFKRKPQPRVDSGDSGPPQKHHARLGRLFHQIFD